MGYVIHRGAMETMQMRARRAANPDSRYSETRKGRWQALGSPKGARAAGGHWGVEEGRMQSAGAARGQARLQIGEGPGCVSGPSVQPGIMPLVPLVPLQATYFIYDKKRTASERDGRMGKSSLIFAYSRLSSLNRRKIMEAQGHAGTSMADHGRSTTDLCPREWLTRGSPDLDRAHWMRGSSDRMNGKTEWLSDHYVTLVSCSSPISTAKRRPNVSR